MPVKITAKVALLSVYIEVNAVKAETLRDMVDDLVVDANIKINK